MFRYIHSCSACCNAHNYNNNNSLLLLCMQGQNYGPYQDIGSTMGTVLILWVEVTMQDSSMKKTVLSIFHLPSISYILYV